MKKAKTIIIFIIVILLLIFSFSYYSFKYNEVADSYDFTTLKNVYLTIDEILDVYEREEFNNQILEVLFDQIHAYAWYSQVSPNLGCISYELDEIAGINYENLSNDDLESLMNVRDELRKFNDKINIEISKVSIKRIFGIFGKTNINELNTIFDAFSL